MKQDPTYNIPADYKLPSDDRPFIPISNTPELFQDFIKKVTDLRTKHSNRKFCPSIIVGDLQEEDIKNNTAQETTEEYECYTNDIGPTSQESPTGSGSTVSNELLHQSEDEAEFIKVVKDAMVSKEPVDPNVFRIKLDYAINKNKTVDFNTGCTCYLDSDDEIQ